MSESREDGGRSAAEVTQLRRRVAELERANRKLRTHLRTGGRAGGEDPAGNEEKLQALFNAVTESILLADGDGAILAMNNTAAERFGHTIEEMIGRRPSDCAGEWMPPEVAQRREAMIREVFESGQARHFEDERPDAHFDVSMYPVCSAEGRVTSVAVFAKDVTERQRAQEKINALQRRIEFILNATQTILSVVDPDFNVRYVAPFRPAYGAYEGRKCYEFVRGLDHPCPECAVPKVLATRQTVVCDRVLPREGGRPIQVTTIPFQAENGEWLVAEVSVDITERKRAEERITELQRRIEFILGATKTGLNITDQGFHVRYVDAARRAVYGEYQGKKCYEYFMGRDQVCPGCGMVKAFASQRSVTCDDISPREGNRPVQVTTIPFQSEAGEWLAAEVNVDLTERQQWESKLRESEERYRTVVETAGEAIAIVDAQGIFQFLNTTAAQRLGGVAADFVGKTMWKLFPREVADVQMAHVRAVIASGQGQSHVSLTSVQGEPRWYGTTVEPLRDGTGKVWAGLVFARDIHDLTTARQELQAYREKMIRAEHLASLGTLSAMLSHEMTQPLTVIRLSIQNALQMLEGAAPPPAVLEDLNEGLAEISHLTTILHRFRDFAGSAGQEAVHPVSLCEIAHKVTRLLEESARKARITLDVEGLQALPSIRAQRRDVEQVFFILAQNALEAAAGTRDHYFRVQGAARDHWVHVQFQDDCGGIASHVLEHLFEPFVTTKPAGAGMGLGLCVVERLVSRAGGHLKVDSRAGEGTTFFVTWPIDPEALGERPWKRPR